MIEDSLSVLVSSVGRKKISAAVDGESITSKCSSDVVGRKPIDCLRTS